MRWLDAISKSMDMSSSKLWEIVKDRKAWWCCCPWGHRELGMTQRRINNNNKMPQQIPYRVLIKLQSWRTSFWSPRELHQCRAVYCARQMLVFLFKMFLNRAFKIPKLAPIMHSTKKTEFLPSKIKNKTMVSVLSTSVLNQKSQPGQLGKKWNKSHPF